jgi:hypothetical protein
MASLPLSGAAYQAHAQDIIAEQGIKAMELFGLLFFVLLALAAATGRTADSRDSADWKPTIDGRRAPRWE